MDQVELHALVKKALVGAGFEPKTLGHEATIMTNAPLIENIFLFPQLLVHLRSTFGPRATMKVRVRARAHFGQVHRAPSRLRSGPSGTGLRRIRPPPDPAPRGPTSTSLWLPRVDTGSTTLALASIQSHLPASALRPRRRYRPPRRGYLRESPSLGQAWTHFRALGTTSSASTSGCSRRRHRRFLQSS